MFGMCMNETKEDGVLTPAFCCKKARAEAEVTHRTLMG